MKTSRLQLKRMIKAALLKEGSSYSEAERKQAVQQALDAVAKAVQILQKYLRGTAKIPTVLYDCTSRGTLLTNTPSTKFTVRYKFSGFVALPIRYGAGYGTVYLRAVRSSIPLRRLRTQVMIVDCVAARSGGHRNNRLLPI